jgi:hypothetical protein
VPITPIKSSITAPPTSKDVSAVLRSIRGAFINPSSDQHSRLQVALPELVLGLSVPSLQLITDESSGTLIQGYIGDWSTGSIGWRYSLDLGGSPLSSYTGLSQTRLSAVFQHGVTAYLSSTFRIVLPPTTDPASPGAHLLTGDFVCVGWYNVRQQDSDDPVFGSSYGPFGSGLIYRRYSDGTSIRTEVALFLRTSIDESGLLNSMVYQEDWNIDCLSISTDIANNPSRVQLDFTRPIQMVWFLDSPHSAVAGFVYDGVFLPAHRFFIETSSSNSYTRNSYHHSVFLSRPVISASTIGICLYNNSFSAHSLGKNSPYICPVVHSTPKDHAAFVITSTHPLENVLSYSPGYQWYDFGAAHGDDVATPNYVLSNISISSSGACVVEVCRTARVALPSTSSGSLVEQYLLTEWEDSITSGTQELAIPGSGNFSIDCNIKVGLMNKLSIVLRNTSGETITVQIAINGYLEF